MNPTRHDRVSGLFLEALGLPADERRAFLQQECGDDADLIAEVEELLARDSRPAAVDRPAVDREVSESALAGASRVRPTQIGRYEIIEELGHGGMGTVYRARQTNPSRDVALKVVHPFVTSTTLSRRVEFEAHVLGRLQHSGIAQIFEAGTVEHHGRMISFFAMELIEGLPLDQYVRQNRTATPERLTLIVRICDAVQHAHQKGVIHRDLKPANILVTVAGQPKVLDFGIARVTDADIRTTTLRTNVGQLIGTIAYMSPEQLAGDPAGIDTRSDVYSLGVVAYELLTGHLPYDLGNRTVADAAQIIRDTDPSLLGTIDRGYRGDIETIIGKALEKDRERRYDSVAEFAADIERHLRNEPIAARPPSMFYQLTKFTRRNRALVGGVMTAFVLLIAAVAGTSYGLVRAQRERDDAIAARENLKVANEQTEAQKEKFLAVNTFLRRMLESANPLSDVGYASKDITVIEMLDRESTAIDAAFAGRPEMEAAMRTTFGSIYAGLGRYDEAEEQYRHALDLHWKTGGLDPDTARAMRDFGSVLCRTGRTAEGFQWFEKALSINHEVSGEDSLETGLTESRYGFALLNAGKIDEAEANMRRGLDKLVRYSPGNETDNVPRAMNNLARALSARKQYDEAELLYTKALEANRKFYGDDHATVAYSLNNIARIRLVRGELDEAAADYTEAARILTAVAGDQHPMLATILNNLASVQYDQKDYETSVATYRRAMAITEHVYGKQHKEYFSTLYNFAFSLFKTKKYDEAGEAYRTVAEYRRKVNGKDHWRTLLAEVYWAECLMETGDEVLAETMLTSALEKLQLIPGIDKAYAQAAVRALIRLYERRGDTERLAAIKALSDPDVRTRQYE